MIITGTQGSSVADPILSTTSRFTSSDTVDSFTSKLASLLEELLSQSGSNAHFQIGVQSAGSQNSGDRQIIVSLSSLDSNATAASTDTSSTSTSSTASNSSTSSTASTAATAAADTTDTQSSGPLKLANGKVVTNEYEAYWATQPAAVQQLMNIDNEADRFALAKDLSDQGYAIDVPIMVWNWDPLATMVVRRNTGYTWVPAAGQDSVKVAPGIQFPNLPTYDPDNPPAGSIPVSIDFAKGFEQTCPWLKMDEIYPAT